MMARASSCFYEIMRLSPDGSPVQENDCMEVCDDYGMEVCDDHCEKDYDRLRDGPNHDIKHSDIFDEQLDAMDTCESNETIGWIEPCDVHLSASTTNRCDRSTLIQQ
jgi:hypothetical protein